MKSQLSQKLLSLILAISLVLSLTVTAFAEGEPGEDNPALGYSENVATPANTVLSITPLFSTTSLDITALSGNTANAAEGWAWYATAADGYSANTLVLNGLNMNVSPAVTGYAIKLPTVLNTLVLIGNNSIVNSNGGGITSGMAMSTDNGITIEGSGSLSITNTGTTSTAANTSSINSDNIVINSGTLNLTSVARSVLYGVWITFNGGTATLTNTASNTGNAYAATEAAMLGPITFGAGVFGLAYDDVAGTYSLPVKVGNTGPVAGGASNVLLHDSNDSLVKNVRISDGSVPTFVAVTGITNVPTTATAESALTLSGTVAPSNATNQVITWSVQNAGETGATISGSTLIATAMGTVIIRATIANGTTATTPYTQDFTITVNAAGTTTYTVTFNPNGGTRTGGGDLVQTITSGGNATAPTITRSGYTFSGWSGTYTNVTSDCTITAQWTANNTGGNGGSDSGSSGGGSSGGGIRDTISNISNPDTPQNVTQAVAAASVNTAVQAAAAAGSQNATANIRNAANISLSVLQSMVNTATQAGVNNILLQADSMNGREIDVRITLNPALATSGLNLSASTTNTQARQTTNTFTRFFSNYVMTVSLGQTGSFGQNVRIAGKLDPKLNTDNLKVYVYNRETNSFTQIHEPNIWIDTNGYVHFNTNMGGEIVFSDGALARRG